MPYTQENRLIAIETPLGKDVLLLAGFSGAESISGLFNFELSLISEDHKISFDDIIGKNVTLSIILADGDKRYFNGIILRFSQGRGGDESGGDPRFSHYWATMVPWTWLLTMTTDSRIFQKLSVPDIVEKIFKEKGFSDFKLKLNGSYAKREYCVQYQETDFNFISRLLEDEGIYYYFEHEDGKHTMIIADAPQENKPCQKQEIARYQLSAGGRMDEDVITSLEIMKEIRPAKYSLSDYNFEIPNTGLEVNVPSKVTLGPGEREIYDYPGCYAKKTEGDRIAKIRIEEEEAKITKIKGSSNCRAFSSGYRFTLSEFYRDDMNNKEYVLISVQHEVNQGLESEAELAYFNQFTCTPFEVPYRPPRTTEKPVLYGNQTAIVVGPSGEEIYTDEYGRVKVQFHWDREGKKDENSSCWIRVSQAWAGQAWGSMHIPHVGHEVIIDFIEGDPDRPIITGRVYHGNNMPADALPGEKTKSVFRDHGGNEQIVEGKDGDKHIVIKQACGNEIRMHESSPDIEIKQECGNEILMKASGPDIEIKQECGNEILMRASGPDIDIKQACGNQILMHSAEGIHMKDKYGNEVKLDAVAGILKLHSPTHQSTIELGKSILGTCASALKWAIAADEIKQVKGKTLWELGGNLHKLTMGGTSEEFVGWKHTSNLGLFTEFSASVKLEENLVKRVKRSRDHKLDASRKIEFIAGKGNASQINMDADKIKINSGSSVITVNKDGKIEIESNEDINISSKANIAIEAKEVRLGAKAKTDLKYAPVTHKFIKIG